MRILLVALTAIFLVGPVRPSDGAESGRPGASLTRGMGLAPRSVGGWAKRAFGKLKAPSKLRIGQLVMVTALVAGHASHAADIDASPGTKPGSETTTSVRAESPELTALYDKVKAFAKAKDAEGMNDFIDTTRRDLKTGTPQVRARLQLVLAAALIAKYKAHMGTFFDAAASFKAVHAAFDLQPDDPVTAMSYGRSVRGIAQIADPSNRFWATGIFGANIDLPKEAVRVADALNKHPTSAMHQELQYDIATFLGNAALLARADANRARIPTAEREAARSELDTDDKAVKDGIAGAKKP